MVAVQSVKPPVAELSLVRCDQYLALLKEIGGRVVARSEVGLPETCVYVRADGFAEEAHERLLTGRRIKRFEAQRSAQNGNMGLGSKSAEL